MEHLSILVGEHDLGHQCLLSQSITKHDPAARLTTVDSRAELLDAARSGPVDCIVVDDNLAPSDTGHLVDELRAHRPNTPILVISSREEQEVVIALLRHGVDDFVPKTCALRTDELWERILSAVAANHQRQHDRRLADRRLQSLQTAAHLDYLTGLQNRRFAERFLHSARSCADRRASAAAIFMDLDHFKAVNDQHGHQVGDSVLRAVSRVLRHHASRADTLVRWGGDEFLTIRTSESIVDAWAWADNIRRTLANTRIAAGEHRLRIAASFGVATSPSAEFGEPTVTMADKALYLAKDWGRNRVCTWPMTVAMEAAEVIQTDASLTPAERLRRLRQELAPRLGAAQAEHIGEHARSVRRVAATLARAMRLSPSQVADVELAAEFHDIGKTAVPESLLATPRRLSPSERRFVAEHARFGADLMRMCGASERVTGAVAGLHGRFDLGYADGPDFLRGESPYTRILTVADAFVAMHSPRPYREPMTSSQILLELRRERGKQFDPDVVDTAHFLQDALLAIA
ncbi:MAG: diguanylate cyclase [Phycisphaerales bacterium]|nr:diguanylate cyclase [Phycisphaerales bacterium]